MSKDKIGIKSLKFHALACACYCMHRKRKAYFPVKKKKCGVVITLKLLYCKLADANWGVEK